jgi:hypothetical protein
MTTPAVPLNTFKLIATKLNSGSNTIYQQLENNVSAIVLSAQITNVSALDQLTSIQIEKSGSMPPVTLLKNATIPPDESLNPFAGKVVLERYDKLIFIAPSSGSLEAVLSVLENAND